MTNAPNRSRLARLGFWMLAWVAMSPAITEGRQPPPDLCRDTGRLLPLEVPSSTYSPCSAVSRIDWLPDDQGHPEGPWHYRRRTVPNVEFQQRPNPEPPR